MTQPLSDRELREFERWPDQWPEWTQQYEETAIDLHARGLYGAADDIATLVMGLVEYEREEAARAALESLAELGKS